jgi:hypothetical protein
MYFFIGNHKGLAKVSRLLLRGFFFLEIFKIHLVRQRNSQARPYGFNNLYPSKKPATVTQQLTKSIDFHQNYLCDFHCRIRKFLGHPMIQTQYYLYESGSFREQQKKN